MSCVFGFWLAGVLAYDFARRRVSNLWLLVGCGLAMASLAWNESPLTVTWLDALSGGFGAFAVLLGFYALGLMGAGDVKFAGVLGLWVGGPGLVPIVIGASLLAGGHALLHLARRYGPSLPGRRNDERGMPAGRETSADASESVTVMNRGIPYAGYLALMALIWLALHAVPTAS